jgi:hypothetical protein
MFVEEIFCNCQNYSGCTCGENQFFAYTGGGTFPMKKGVRGEHVRALQVALNTKFNTPAALRIITPTDFWGDKTEALMRYHGLPLEIPNAQVLQQILEGKVPNTNTSGTNTPTASANTWKDSLKDPNKALGLFGQLTSAIGNLRNNNQNQVVRNQDLEFRLGQQDFGASGLQAGQGNLGNNPQQQRRLPAAAWIAIVLVGLLFIGLLVFKLAK